MIVEKLPGTDARLYALVAPLVMSVPIIRQNNNYPFKTSRKHLWFIALERGEVKGFMPVERKTAGVDFSYRKSERRVCPRLHSLCDFSCSAC